MSGLKSESTKKIAAYTQGPNNYGAIAHFCFTVSKANIEKICIEHKMFTSISFHILPEKFFAPITLLGSDTRGKRVGLCKESNMIVSSTKMLQWPTHRVLRKFLHRYSICCMRKRPYFCQGAREISNIC